MGSCGSSEALTVLQVLHEFLPLVLCHAIDLFDEVAALKYCLRHCPYPDTLVYTAPQQNIAHFDLQQCEATTLRGFPFFHWLLRLLHQQYGPREDVNCMLGLPLWRSEVHGDQIHVACRQAYDESFTTTKNLHASWTIAKLQRIVFRNLSVYRRRYFNTKDITIQSVSWLGSHLNGSVLHLDFDPALASVYTKFLTDLV